MLLAVMLACGLLAVLLGLSAGGDKREVPVSSAEGLSRERYPLERMGELPAPRELEGAHGAPGEAVPAVVSLEEIEPEPEPKAKPPFGWIEGILLLPQSNGSTEIIDGYG